SAVAEFFQFPPSYRRMTIACLVGFCIFAVFSAFLPLIDPGSKSWAIATIAVPEFALFGLLAARAALMSRDRVAVSDDGIWYLPHRGTSTFMRWDEIAKVEVRELTKRLVIADATSHKRINLEYQLDRFDRLRSLVLDRTAARRRQTFASAVSHG